MKEGFLGVFLLRSVRYSLLGFYLESDLIKNSSVLVAIVRAYQMSIVCGVHLFFHSNLILLLYFILHCYFFSEFVQPFLNSYLVFY